MAVWRVTDDGESFRNVWGVPPQREGPVRHAPEYDLVEYDTALLRVVSATGSSWLRLTGDVDVSNCDELARILRAAGERVPGDLHLDLSRVDFMDVAGLRVLTKAAHVLDGGNRMLLLHSVSPHIAKLVHLIGWDAAPGLLVHCRSRPAP